MGVGTTGIQVGRTADGRAGAAGNGDGRAAPGAEAQAEVTSAASTTMRDERGHTIRPGIVTSGLGG